MSVIVIFSPASTKTISCRNEECSLHVIVQVLVLVLLVLATGRVVVESVHIAAVVQFIQKMMSETKHGPSGGKVVIC